jgi:hypothetical protein
MSLGRVVTGRLEPALRGRRILRDHAPLQVQRTEQTLRVFVVAACGELEPLNGRSAVGRWRKTRIGKQRRRVLESGVRLRAGGPRVPLKGLVRILRESVPTFIHGAQVNCGDSIARERRPLEQLNRASRIGTHPAPALIGLPEQPHQARIRSRIRFHRRERPVGLGVPVAGVHCRHSLVIGG